MEHIFHVLLPEDWSAAADLEEYEAASLAIEGFIHCSFEGQVAGVLERYYKGVDAVILLEIDPTRLTAPLKIEFTATVNQDFPHIFGTINKSAIASVKKMVLIAP